MKQSQSSHSIWAETEPYCILRRLWKNLWMILMSAALFALVAYIWTSLFLTQRYTCTATFVVSPRNNTTAYQSSSAITSTTTAQFASLLSGSPLVNRVRRLSGSDVQGATVSATVVKDTNLIQLKTYGPSPRAAYYMCVGILDHYEEYSQIVFRSVILEPVSAPNVPDKSALKRTQRKTILLAAPVGALVMTALLVLLTILSGTVQTVAGAKNQVDGSLLVTLNHQRKRKTLRSLLRRRKTSLLISNPTTSFLYVETIHQLRTHVEHAKHKHGCKTFLVTSVSENEGKSTVAANLALSLARRHKKVLLVDCDLRKSAQHLIFEATPDKSVTLNALLKGELEPDQLVRALQYRKSENLFFLFASNVSRHSAELLGSGHMAQLLAVLRENFDYVVLDSSPMGFFTDSEILSDLADASMLVVRQDMLPDRTVNDAIDSLSKCKSRFLGFVFNDVHTLNVAARIIGGRRYGYGHGYGYGYGYGYGSYKDKYYGYGYGKTKSRRGSTDQQDEKDEGESVKLATSRRKED